ncbi:MAG: sulfite exporter TauE/SafE family protein [Pseudomonadota bacterium]
MEFSWAFYAVAAGAVLVTGVSKSGFAGGLGVMSVPLMTLFVPPSFAVAVFMPLLVGMDALIVWRYRKTWDRPAVAALLPGAAIGVAIGAATFAFMPAALVTLVVGVLALIFVANFFFRGAPAADGAKPARRGLALILGAVSGFAGYIAHAGGPAVKGYLLSRGFDKTTFVGTNSMFFAVMNLMKTGSYAATGLFTMESLSLSALLAPLLFVGVGIGLALHRVIDQRVFMKLVYGLLALAGVRLVWDGVAGF